LLAKRPDGRKHSKWRHAARRPDIRYLAPPVAGRTATAHIDSHTALPRAGLI